MTKNKNTEGYLTVEATLSLTIFLFFMMFLTNYGQIYMAQNYVTHGLLQTGKMLAMSSYEYEQDTTFAGAVTDILTFLFGKERDAAEESAKVQWKYGSDTDKKAAVETVLPYGTAANPSEFAEGLKRYGINNVVMENAVIDGNDLIITTKYEVKLAFAFFGYEKIEMHQQVRSGLWK